MSQKIFGYDAKGVLGNADITGKKKAGNSVHGRIFYVGVKGKSTEVVSKLTGIADWQLKRAKKSNADLAQLTSDKGPVWILNAKASKSGNHDGLLDKSPYSIARELMGTLAIRVGAHDLGEIHVQFVSADDEEKLGALVGIEVASYRYCQVSQPKDYPTKAAKFVIKGVNAALLKKAKALGTGINTARHLVNTPAGDLNPTTYASQVKKMFSGIKNIKVEVWSGKRLEKERMGLLQAVGQASDNGPCMIHIKYSPTGKKNKKPYAFVGKGVTFDSGGLDIKPGAGMRLMKKDMGGSASLVGFAQWLQASGSKTACDIYLAVAENSIDERSFRPGDVIRSRNGLTVEIHNTDAEGRLVLADVLEVASSKKGAQSPEMVINLATLTGAMRVGLGTKVAGLFSNNDKIAEKLMKAGQKRGDGLWRMPLIMDYKKTLKTSFADINHCSSSRFGGAISAAVFLSHFINGKPWAHIDMMSWAERAEGPIAEAGGNGQCVQALAEFITGMEK
jgi:leucyl aminopeptidase